MPHKFRYYSIIHEYTKYVKKSHNEPCQGQERWREEARRHKTRLSICLNLKHPEAHGIVYKCLPTTVLFGRGIKTWLVLLTVTEVSIEANCIMPTLSRKSVQPILGVSHAATFEGKQGIRLSAILWGVLKANFRSEVLQSCGTIALWYPHLLLGWMPSLLGWRPSLVVEAILVGWRPSLLGWRPLIQFVSCCLDLFDR